MKTGFTCSTFDLLHAGHILMLNESRRHCDTLIVGLQIDPTIDRPDTKNKPVQSILERQIQLEAVEYVDSIFIYETEKDLMDLLTILNIDIRFIGEEYKDKDFTGKQYCIDNGIEIFYNSRKHRFSTTELRKRAGLSNTDI
jgi:glycerol-3-phosphate cytidylyltransferase